MIVYEIGTGYTSIPARMGAATEIVVEELTRAMLKAGVDVTILDIKDKNRKESDLPICEVYMPQIFSTGAVVKLGIIHKVKRVLYSISLANKLKSLIKKGNKQVCLHFHNQYNLFFFLKLIPKSLREKVRIAYTVHSYIWFGKWDEIEDTVKKRYFQEVYCCQQADRVFVLNDIVAKMLVEHCGVNPERIIKVINGVNVDVYNDDNVDRNEIEKLKGKYGLQNKRIIIQVGSVCGRKNQLGTLRLLLPMMKKDPDLAMIYAGGIIDSEYAQEIQNLARKEGVSNRVLYMGEVSPGKELNNLYALSDIAIMNSKSEAFALVIAEALAARKPIFICDEIMRSLVFLGGKEGHGIIRITPTFEQDLNRLLTDTTYYNQMQDAGREFITNEYSWEVAAKMYLNHF